MYRIQIYGWTHEGTEVTPYDYWTYAKRGLVVTDVPPSYRRSSASVTRLYRQKKDYIFVDIHPKDLFAMKLSPGDIRDVYIEEIMQLMDRATREGLDVVAKEIGMRLPPNHYDPEGYFEENAKFYIQKDIINDFQIINDLGYIPIYGDHLDLLLTFHAATDQLVAPVYYKNGIINISGELHAMNELPLDKMNKCELESLFRLSSVVKEMAQLRLALGLIFDEIDRKH